MLLVKTVVKPSSIEGLGLFADEDIAEGQLIWRYDPSTTLLITKAHLETLIDSCNHSQIVHHYLTYGYYVARLDAIVLCLDNFRFFNHSTSPNSGIVNFQGEHSCALRPIQRGEELVENYETYDFCEWKDHFERGHHIFNPVKLQNCH